MPISLPEGYRPASLMFIISPWSLVVDGDLKHDGGRENTPRTEDTFRACGRTTLNGMEIGCREETEWLNRAPSRDRGKEGYITAPNIPPLFFICNSLFGAYPPGLLPLRLAFSSISISDLVDSCVTPPFLEILVCSVTERLRINKTISFVLFFKIALLLKKDSYLGLSMWTSQRRIHIYFLLLYSTSFFLPTCHLHSLPHVNFPSYFLCLLLRFIVFPILISLRFSVFFFCSYIY